MFFEIQLTRNVVLSPDKLYSGLLLKRSIILQLIEDISRLQADEEYGYYITVTTLEGTGEAKIREITGSVVFPVKFRCIVCKPFINEVLTGVVNAITKLGICLYCGPMKEVFIPAQFMSDFELISGANPIYKKQDLTIEKGTEVRFRLMGVKWNENNRLFRVLGTLEGDYLGPIYDVEMDSRMENVEMYDASKGKIPSSLGKSLGGLNGKASAFTQPCVATDKYYTEDDVTNSRKARRNAEELLNDQRPDNDKDTGNTEDHLNNESNLDIDSKVGILQDAKIQSEKRKRNKIDFTNVEVIELD